MVHAQEAPRNFREDLAALLAMYCVCSTDFMTAFVRKDKYNPTDHEYLVDVSSKKSTTKESEDKLVDETDLGENERENVAFGFDSGSEGPNSDAETADDASSASSEPARKKSKSNKKRARAASSTPSPKKPKSKPTRGLSKADLELQVATEARDCPLPPALSFSISLTHSLFFSLSLSLSLSLSPRVSVSLSLVLKKYEHKTFFCTCFFPSSLPTLSFSLTLSLSLSLSLPLGLGSLCRDFD